MQDDHPSLETLASWLAGELDHDKVRRDLAPHFLEKCPVCRQMREEIERLLEESGHWSELVALRETREAPDLLPLLGEGSHEERMRRAAEVEELHTWGVCQLLLKQSREEVFSDPARAVETAHLAIRVVGHLSEAYHPGWVLELEARAHALFGNGLRVLGELKAADEAFLQAKECLERSNVGNPGIEAEILSLEGSLRLDQRRLEEALELVERACVLYQENQDGSGVGKALLQKFKIHMAQKDLGAAIQALRDGISRIDPEKAPRLSLQAQQNLLAALTLAGQFQEAELFLPAVQELFQAMAEPLDRLRLRWTEASISQGLGRHGEAEAVYREVQQAFLEMGKNYDWALVSLDLAALLLEHGRREELKRLSAELVAVFESREVYREAWAALLLFRQACEEERVTLELIRQVASQLFRERELPLR